MLAGVLRGVLMVAMLALFMWTHDRFLMLACAMCAGAILGHEIYRDQCMGIIVFALIVPVCYLFISLHGAIMTASFFPISVSLLQGFINFLLLVAIGSYWVWKIESAMDFVEEEGERAGAQQ